MNVWLNLLQTPLLLPMLTGPRSSSSNRAATATEQQHPLCCTRLCCLRRGLCNAFRLVSRLALRVARFSRLCRQVVAANYAKKLVKLIKTKPQREVAKANTLAHTHRHSHTHCLLVSPLSPPPLPLLACGKMLKCDDVENAAAGGKQLEQGHNMFCRISTNKYSRLTSLPLPTLPTHTTHTHTHRHKETLHTQS